jgi:hypothetical protein
MLACGRNSQDIVEAVDHFVGALQAVLSFLPLLLDFRRDRSVFRNTEKRVVAMKILYTEVQHDQQLYSPVSKVSPCPY